MRAPPCALASFPALIARRSTLSGRSSRWLGERDADARGDLGDAGEHHRRVRDAHRDALGEALRGIAVGHVAAHQDEPFAVDVRDDVAWAGDRAQALGDRLEEMCAGRVAEALLDEGEVVELHRDDGETAEVHVAEGQPRAQAVEVEHGDACRGGVVAVRPTPARGSPPPSRPGSTGAATATCDRERGRSASDRSPSEAVGDQDPCTVAAAPARPRRRVAVELGGKRFAGTSRRRSAPATGESVAAPPWSTPAPRAPAGRAAGRRDRPPGGRDARRARRPRWRPPPRRRRARRRPARSSPRTTCRRCGRPALSAGSDRRVDAPLTRPDHQRKSGSVTLSRMAPDTPPYSDRGSPLRPRRPRHPGREARLGAPARGGSSRRSSPCVALALAAAACAPPGSPGSGATGDMVQADQPGPRRQPASVASPGTTSSTAWRRATPRRSRPAVAVALRPRRVDPAPVDGGLALARREPDRRHPGRAPPSRSRTSWMGSPPHRAQHPERRVQPDRRRRVTSTERSGTGWSRCSVPGSRPYLALSGAGPRLAPDGDRARPARGPGRHFRFVPVAGCRRGTRPHGDW